VVEGALPLLAPWLLARLFALVLGERTRAPLALSFDLRQFLPQLLDRLLEFRNLGLQSLIVSNEFGDARFGPDGALLKLADHCGCRSTLHLQLNGGRCGHGHVMTPLLRHVKPAIM